MVSYKKNFTCKRGRGNTEFISEEFSRKYYQIKEIPVIEAMIPIDQTETLSRGAKRKEILQKSKQTGFTRFPIYDPLTQKVYAIVNVLNIFYEEEKQRTPLHVSSLASILK